MTEGQSDVWGLVQGGIGQPGGVPDDTPVSTMGARVSDEQIEMLAEYERVVLAFDDDVDGRAVTVRVGDELLPRMGPGEVMVACQFPVGVKDPGDLVRQSRKKVRTFISTLIPYDEWRLRPGSLDGITVRGKVGSGGQGGRRRMYPPGRFS